MWTLSEKILLTLITLQGLSGLAGYLRSNRRIFRFTSAMPDNTMFDTYFIPGVILFVVLGMFQ